MRSFIHRLIDEDITRSPVKLKTRFAPEPNGYLHIGHVKTLLANYDIAQFYKGVFVLRFDDTNPHTIKTEYYQQILADLRYLDITPSYIYYASDYFSNLARDVIRLIEMNKAYVCHHTSSEIEEMKGNFKDPGVDSAYRDRAVEENLLLFDKMATGEYQPGECTVRAKISMSSPNMLMRDPILYRIKDIRHLHTGLCHHVYPSYDFAHPLSDYYEKITHSLCTREFEDHRPFYKWLLQTLYPTSTYKQFRPRQIEYARLNIKDVVTSKRELLRLGKRMDDPILYTLAGLKNRGLPGDALKFFIRKLGLSKQESILTLDDYRYETLKFLHKSITTKTTCVLEPIGLKTSEGSTLYVEKDDYSLTSSYQKERMIKKGVVFGIINHAKAYILDDDTHTISTVDQSPDFYLHGLWEKECCPVEIKDYTQNREVNYKQSLISNTCNEEADYIHAYRIGYMAKRQGQYSLFMRLKQQNTNV